MHLSQIVLTLLVYNTIKRYPFVMIVMLVSLLVSHPFVALHHVNLVYAYCIPWTMGTMRCQSLNLYFSLCRHNGHRLHCATPWSTDILVGSEAILT